VRRHPTTALPLVSLVTLVLGGGAAGGGSVLACSPKVHEGVLPAWMRGGFTGPRPRIPYVIGSRGQIGGVLFGSPLDAPPAKAKNNKILWVPRRVPRSVAPLRIEMQKMEGTRLVGAPVRRTVATGPGPSSVDAPSAGCWRLTLTWSGRQDWLDLRYVAPAD
jgi:hypothetical protein